MDRSATSGEAVELVLAAEDEVVATLDRRFLSYNVEMVEVTGGRFWQPYDAGVGKVTLPPLDLTSPRLRNLARALGPSYVRVSGSWASHTWFDADGSTNGKAPQGFHAVLTAEQWQGVGEFARSVNAEIVTSFASSPGARDASGAWQPDQARTLLEFSKAHDIPVTAAELINEPVLPIHVPDGYNASAFAADLRTFLAMIKEVRPDLKVVGPSSTNEVHLLPIRPSFTADEVMRATGPVFDVFSYHFYPKPSERWGDVEGPEVALTEEFLARVTGDHAHFTAVRDAHQPGIPIWITEVAEAAGGGDRWASTYLDVVRFVDTLGRLGDGDGNAVFHNTLTSSDYGLLDGDHHPRPNYWAAVVWHELMSGSVLDTRAASGLSDLSVYAHRSTSRHEGSVTYAVVNSSATTSRTVTTRSGRAIVYQLTGPHLQGPQIALNGTVLEAWSEGGLPDLSALHTSGAVVLPPASVTFVIDPK